jgi:hypothetical protein
MYDEIRGNIILLSMSRSSKWSLLGFPIRMLCGFVSSTMRATSPAHFIPLYLITRIMYAAGSGSSGGYIERRERQACSSCGDTTSVLCLP